MRLEAGEAAVGAARRLCRGGRVRGAVRLRSRPALRRVRGRRGSTSGTWCRRSGTRCTGTSSRRRRCTGISTAGSAPTSTRSCVLLAPLFWISVEPGDPARRCRRSRWPAVRSRSSGSRASISTRRARARSSRSPISSIPATQFNAFTIGGRLPRRSRSRCRSCSTRSGSSTRTGSSRSRSSRCSPSRRRRRSRSRSAASGSGTRSGEGTGCSVSACSRRDSLVTLFNFLWVIPHFSPTGVQPFAGRYAAVGGTPQGMAHKLFTDPMAFVHAVASGHKAGYRRSAARAVPRPLAASSRCSCSGPCPTWRSTCSRATRTRPRFNSSTPRGSFRSSLRRASSAQRASSAGRWTFRCGASPATAAVAIYSPIYLGASDVRALGSPLVSAKAHAVSLIPNGVPVSASNQLGGHLSERRYIYTFPYVRRARWIVVDLNDWSYPDVARLQASDPEVRGEQERGGSSTPRTA